MARLDPNELPAGIADVSELTPFATVFRYEEMPYSSTFDRARSLRFVQQIRSHVEAVVGDIPKTG